MTNRKITLTEMQRSIRYIVGRAGGARNRAESRDYLGAFEDLALVENYRREMERQVFDLMRAEGRTWKEIGAELGVSRQAAQKRYRLASSQ